MIVEHLAEVSSTNEYIRKYLGGGEDVIVTARCQTGGRGTKGRSFLSEEGGVYLSALTFYRDFPADEAFRVMAHAAVAVCETLEGLGLSPEVKWPNDVLISGKKVSGILTENVIRGGMLAASVVGIGINVRNDISAIRDIAAEVCDYVPCTMEEVRDTLIENYRKETSFGRYLSFVHLAGKQVRVLEGDKSFSAVARRVLTDGRLEVEADGTVRTLSAAEVSLRPPDDDR